MAITQITDTDFDSKVLQADKPVLVDFYADWCGPCRALTPALEQIASERADVDVVKVNVDDSSVAQQLGVMSLPTLVLFKAGREADRINGLVPKARIEQLLA